MSSVVLTGDTSGSGTITVPAVAGSFTATIGSATGTHYPFTAGTAVASTSGTSIDFTSIPSWVKRITVLFQGVSTSGTSNPLIQLGSGSTTTSGYLTYGSYAGGTNACGGSNWTTGFGVALGSAVNLMSGNFVFTLISSNTWIGSYVLGDNTSGTYYSAQGGGSIALSGTLDRVRITTINGTDTFDAGSINILYE